MFQHPPLDHQKQIAYVKKLACSPNMRKIRQLSAKIDTSERVWFFVPTHGSYQLQYRGIENTPP